MITLLTLLPQSLAFAGNQLAACVGQPDELLTYTNAPRAQDANGNTYRWCAVQVSEEKLQALLYCIEHQVLPVPDHVAVIDRTAAAQALAAVVIVTPDMLIGTGEQPAVIDPAGKFLFAPNIPAGQLLTTCRLTLVTED